MQKLYFQRVYFLLHGFLNKNHDFLATCKTRFPPKTTHSDIIKLPQHTSKDALLSFESDDVFTESLTPSGRQLWPIIISNGAIDPCAVLGLKCNIFDFVYRTFNLARRTIRTNWLSWFDAKPNWHNTNCCRCPRKQSLCIQWLSNLRSRKNGGNWAVCISTCNSKNCQTAIINFWWTKIIRVQADYKHQLLSEQC